ncbi:MAG TPA: lipopolysaccharide biosynthesis protein [Thiobacillus sp.]|nr:MAG: lipopolysaccharide biosynthesis protein [Hydrogenophilales bacterium 16-64-40]OZA35003.1 MAG: lipopolysaccharide biosynthesis protein [Hydrogenophilales bacterium 17-64-65]HQS80880.1 lipopolysaccharide biosynthesis protein [Thiobacillus sp.]HQT33504.1 lipopolysaccharide biosynthesis protein [Thiobacillus sp.]
MSLGQTMRHGIAWMFVGNTGRQVLTFLFGIVLARLLAPEDFGILLTIQVFTGLAGFVAGGGMGQALVRAKEATKQDYDIVFTLQLGIGCLIYAGFFFAAPWFAKWYDTPLYADLLRVSALSFIFRPLVNLPASMLYRNMRYKAQTIVGITSLLVSSGTSILMAWLGYGVWSLIWGGIAGAAFSAALMIPLTRWRPGFSLEFRRGRDIARYGILVSANDIVGYLHNQVSIFILSRTLGPTSVGLFNKGKSLATMPHSFITGSVYHVLFRAMAAEQDNLDKCRYLFFRSIALVAVYATPFYIGLLWLSEPFIRGIYGEKWVAAAGPLMILAFAWPFWLMDNLSGAVLAAQNWLGRELPVQIATLIITALGITIALPYGIEGVAWAIVGVAVYSAFHLYWLATRCLRAKLSGFFKAVAPAAVLNGLLALVLFSADSTLPASVTENDFAYMALMGATGGLIYIVSFLYLPFRSLGAERERWKIKLKLAKAAA